MLMVEKNNMDLFLFLTLLLCFPLIGTENTDCNGRSFHCANSTHFMICVDVGGGVSMTISSLVLPCPPTTFCFETNNFECEFQTPTTQDSIIDKSDNATEATETNTTTITYGDNVFENDTLNKENTFVLPLQKYSIATTNQILDDNMMDTTSSTKLHLVAKNEAENKNETDNKDNLNKKLKPVVAINLNKTNKIKLQSLDSKPEYEQIVNNVIEEVNTKVKLSHENFTTEIIPSELVDNFSGAVTTLNSSDFYNSEDITENIIITNSTENSTTKILINNTENNLFTDSDKSITAAMTKETTEIIKPDKFRDTKFISNTSFANSTLKEPSTMVFSSNFSFIDVDNSNNSTNEEDNIPLNIVSNNNGMLQADDIYSTTEQVFTTENIQSLKQTNSYINTVKKKQSINVTKETYQDPILTTTSNEAFATVKAENFLEKSTNTYTNVIKVNSTPIPKMCNNQIGYVNCFENNTTNITNESTTISTVDTSFRGVEGISDVTTPNMLNTDKDYFTLYDENVSTIIMGSTDSSDSLKSFTNSYSENKLHDITPSTISNYPINKMAVKSFNQHSNGPFTTVNIVANTEKEIVNTNLVTETSPINQIFSDFESAATTLKPSDYFDTMDVKQNISDINMIQNTTTHHLKLVMPANVYKDETKIFETGTDAIDNAIKNINTEIADKLAKNKENDFADKIFTSDKYVINDSFIDPVTSMNNNMSLSDVSINHEQLLNSTKTDENEILRNNITENVDDFTKEGFRLIEQTINVETTSKNSKPGEVMTTLYPDEILPSTTLSDVTTIYFKKSFHGDFVTSYPKHGDITSSNFVSKVSNQRENIVFSKNNNSLSFVHKNITTDNTLPSSFESNRDITTPSILETDKDIFTLNEESLNTALLTTTNSSYLLDSSVKLKNQDGIIEKDSILDNHTTNSLPKRVPNGTLALYNNLLNLNTEIKTNNDSLDNETLKESSSYVIENQDNLTDIVELKAQDSLNLDILDSNSKLYDTTNVNHTNENVDIHLQKVKRLLINTTPFNPDIKFRDLEPTTVKSIENINFNNNSVKSFKQTFGEKKNSAYYESNLNITTVEDDHQPEDNNFYNNLTSNKPIEELAMKQFENQNISGINVNQSRVQVSHEKNINDSQKYKSINEQINSETVTETTSNLMEQNTRSSLDDKEWEEVEKEAITRSLFDTSTLINENTQENISTKIDEEINRKILENVVFNFNENTSESATGISYAMTDSLNEENSIFKKKPNYHYMKINNSGFNKNDNYLVENSTKSTVDLIRNETDIKFKSTNILLNDTHYKSQFTVSNKTNPYINAQNVFNETQALPDHAMVIDEQQRHLISGVTTTDKTFYSTVATNVKKTYETATLVVNVIHEDNITKYKMDKNHGIVLNNTSKNYNKVSPLIGSDKELDERYMSVDESNQDILLKTKGLELMPTTHTSYAVHKISNSTTEFIVENVSEMFNDSDSTNNTGKRDLDQLKIPVNNITGITDSIEKEHEFAQSTTQLYDPLLNTPVSNQINLKGFATTAGTITETIPNRETVLDVTTYFPRFGDSENFMPSNDVLSHKETAPTFSNDFSTSPSILLKKMEDIASIKSTTESNSNTETRPMEIDRTNDNKSNESRLITDDIKQSINNINISWNQALYENNNKPSNLSETDIFNNVSLKFPGYYIGTRDDEKKNITNINLMKDSFLQQSSLMNNLNLSYSDVTSTGMPNSLKFFTHLENNKTRQLSNTSLKIKLHGPDKINVTTYSDSSTYKNELIKHKNTIKHLTPTSKHSNTTTISQITYHNNNLFDSKAVNKSSSITRISVLYCKNNFRGKIADKDNCRKFYICMGNSIAVVGLCPINTVFSDFKKQCTNNLSHCVRNHQFQCTREGRFGDVTKNNVYYICVKGSNHNFIRFKFLCQNGYSLDKKNVMCKIEEKMLKSSSSSLSSNDKQKNKKLENRSEPQIKQNFKCEEEGKFVDPFNSRRYYICFKTSKLVLRRRRKKCDSDEVFDNDKNKCVDREESS